jgi:hypothetical protein
MPVTPGLPDWVEDVGRDGPAIIYRFRIRRVESVSLRPAPGVGRLTGWVARRLVGFVAVDVGPILHRTILEAILARAHEVKAVAVVVEWPDGKETRLW